MDSIASQITSLTIVYSAIYSGTDRRKHQNSASLAFVRGIHRGPMNSPHKWPVTRKMFPFDDVINVSFHLLAVLVFSPSPGGLDHNGCQLELGAVNIVPCCNPSITPFNAYGIWLSTNTFLYFQFSSTENMVNVNYMLMHKHIHKHWMVFPHSFIILFVVGAIDLAVKRNGH